MRLRELLASAGLEVAVPAADPEIDEVTEDSREAGPGALFVAVRGTKRDGADFAAEAVARGAVAVVAGSPRPVAVPAAVPWLEVADEREALARLAAARFGHPGRSLAVTGVTGTKGKTTTSFLLAAVGEAAGEPTALSGTVLNRIAGREVPAALTTPSASALQRFLAAARAAGMRSAVIEVSSHALDQRRVAAVGFAAAVFTNLHPDHLDYHESVEDYFAAKRRLFVGPLAAPLAAINVDGRHGARLAAEHPHAVTFGSTAEADVRPLSVEVGRQGTRVLAAVPGGRQVLLDSPLLGRFQAANLLAAAAWAVARELPLEALREGVRAVERVPGRLEPVDRGQPFTCLVDYAHMGPALAAALEAAREWTSGRVLVVAGAGGNRDRARRRGIGEAAARLAHRAFLTSDNSRDEDPLAILEEIVQAYRAAGGADPVIEPDRRAAIHAAVRAAQPGDTLVVAGKGHETVQIVRGERRPFDDRLVLAEALAARGFSS